TNVIKIESHRNVLKPIWVCSLCYFLLKFCISHYVILFMFRSFYTCHQRFGYCRRRGILALKFNRRTALELTTKLSYEALHPPLCQTAVRCWRSVHCVVKSLSVVSFAVIVVSAVRWWF